MSASPTTFSLHRKIECFMKKLLLLITGCVIISCSSKTNISYDYCQQVEEQILTASHENSFHVSNSTFLELLNSDSLSISYSFPLLKDYMSIIESEDGLVRIYDDLYDGEDEEEANGFSKCTIQYKDEDGIVHAVWGDIKEMTGAWKEGDGYPASGYLGGNVKDIFTFQVADNPVYVVELAETYPYQFSSITLIAFHIHNGEIKGYPFFKHKEPSIIEPNVEYRNNPVCTEFGIETDGFPDEQGMDSYAYDKVEKILFWIPYEGTYDYYDAYHFDGKNLRAIECDVKKLFEKHMADVEKEQ